MTMTGTLELEAPRVAPVEKFHRFRVTRATEGDVGALCALAEKMHGESEYRSLDFSAGKILELARRVVRDENYGCWVAKTKMRTVGFMAGYVVEYFFGNDWVARDVGLYVEREYRGSHLGAALLGRFKAWARGKGAKELALGVSAQSDNSRTYALYELLGLVEAGRCFKIRLDRLG